LQKLQKVQVSITSGTYIEPERMTVGEWLDIWLDGYIANLKDATERSYRDSVRLHIKPRLGAVPLQKLKAHTVQGFYNELSKSGRILQKGQKKDTPAGLSAKSVRIHHAILHKALNQAVLLGYIPANPTSACILPRQTKKEMQILPEGDLPAFLKAAEGHKHRALFLTLLFSGMRRGEALGLTWSAVNFSKGVIIIKQQLQRHRVDGGALRLVPLKNDKSRTITPPKTVFDLLRVQQRKQAETRELAQSLWTDSDLVFTNDFGGALDGDAVYASYKKLLRANGLPDIRLHDLRHTAATLMLQNGDDVKTVQETLGHHTAAFTLDVYGHVTGRMRKESAMRMERRIKKLTSSKGSS
jgi:integrase